MLFFYIFTFGKQYLYNTKIKDYETKKKPYRTRTWIKHDCSVCQSGNTETRQIKEEGKTVFNPHWFMQVQAGASHTVGEAKFGDLISPAAALNVGYQFTPLWGLRAGLSGWEAKGAWVSPETIYKYNYLQGNVDATLDLSNLFCGTIRHVSSTRICSAVLV